MRRSCSFRLLCIIVIMAMPLGLFAFGLADGASSETLSGAIATLLIGRYVWRAWQQETR